MRECPPCRACKSNNDVIVYPDAHDQTICPECCDKATHPNGETGHEWYRDKWEGDVCEHCGIQKRCTEYAFDRDYD